jgi:type IV pilus assembly protein PilW
MFYRHQTGMTLIELMVALAIGMFLMIGAITVFMQGRTSFRVTESVARLQENARYVLDVLEPDIRMAGYLGLTNRPWLVSGRTTENPLTLPTTGTLSGSCGANWPIDLDNGVAATNNSYSWDCAGQNVDTGSDTLLVRRVAEDTLTAAQVNAATAGTLFVQSLRGGGVDGTIFTGTTPTNFDTLTQELHMLVANGYYVSTQSSLGTTIPSLRMKTLVAGRTIEDREVLPGVEDMQVQLGIDVDPEGAANRGVIDRYVNPGDALLATANVLAVRLWLRVRAERLENGFTDGTTYNYADENQTYNDGFRRVVVSKTIYLRNARR